MDANEVVTLKVDGKEIQMPLSKVLEAAQKNSSADLALQRAREMEKDLKSQLENSKFATQVVEDLMKMKGGDLDAARRVFINLGNDADKVDEVLGAFQEAMNEPAPTSSAVKGLSPEQVEALRKQLAPQKDPMMDAVSAMLKPMTDKGLTPQQIGTILAGNLTSQGQGLVRKNVMDALDKNAFFVDIINRSKGGSSTRENVASIVENTLARRLSNEKRQLRDSDFGEAVEETAKLLGALPIRDAETDLALSTGQSGADASLTADYFRNAPKERPSMLDTQNFDMYTLKRMTELVSAPDNASQG